jgi:hypothetical protein
VSGVAGHQDTLRLEERGFNVDWHLSIQAVRRHDLTRGAQNEIVLGMFAFVAMSMHLSMILRAVSAANNRDRRSRCEVKAFRH